MIRRPPRSTRTDTLFPYTTLFRSLQRVDAEIELQAAIEAERPLRVALVQQIPDLTRERVAEGFAVGGGELDRLAVDVAARSAERRVGKECVSTCRSRWSPSHQKKKKTVRQHIYVNTVR